MKAQVFLDLPWNEFWPWLQLGQTDGDSHWNLDENDNNDGHDINDDHDDSHDRHQWLSAGEDERRFESGWEWGEASEEVEHQGEGGKH